MFAIGIYLCRKKMREINITFNESDITKRIYAESGYIAKARARTGLPDDFIDTIQATEDDTRVLNGFIKESINESAGTINRYLSPCRTRFIGTEGDKLISISFTLPHNAPESTAEALKESIACFTVARTLQYWYMSVKPDEASLHMSKAQSELARMRELLGTRTRPAREGYRKGNIIEI